VSRLICTFIIMIATLMPQLAEANHAQATIEVVDGDFYVYYNDEQYAGPFQFCYIIGVFSGDVLFIEMRSGDSYVHWRELEYGPYEEVTVVGVYEGDVMMYYRIDGKYYVQWGQTYGSYVAARKLRYRDGNAYAEVRNGRNWTDIHFDRGEL